MSQPMQQPGPVVVGTDGSLTSRRAVSFAAGEAARRGRALRIVNATPWAEATDHEDGLRHRVGTWTLADTDVVLREAADLAAEVLPEREIVTVTGVGWPAAVLLDEAKRADLLVVGNRGLGGFSGLLLGSVGVEVAGQAECPVLVVRHPASGEPERDAPVVVGVDGSRRSAAALDAAFQAAELAGAPLVVVHAWHPPAVVGLAQIPALAYQNVHRPTDEAALMSAVLEPYAATHAGVRVTTLIRQGHAGRVLVDASAGARLLVVATRGHGELAGMLLGSTSQSAIHHAECPVLLVPASRHRARLASSS